MSTQSLETRLGIAITVMAALAVTLLVLFGDAIGGSGVDLLVEVESSADLKPGAPVKIAGMTAGKVVDVHFIEPRLEPDSGRVLRVVARLRIKEEMFDSLKLDARPYITSQGLLGEKYVEVHPGSEDGRALQPGARIVAEPPVRLEEMALNMSRLTASLSRIVHTNEGNIEDTMKNAEEAMEAVNRTMGRFDTLVADNEDALDRIVVGIDEVQSEATTLIESANTALEDGEPLNEAIAAVTELAEQVGDELAPIALEITDTVEAYSALADTAESTLEEASDSYESLMKEAEGIVKSASQMVGRLEDGQGTIGALLQDDEMYDDVREMVKDFKRHPWKFVWKE